MKRLNKSRKQFGPAEATLGVNKAVFNAAFKGAIKGIFKVAMNATFKANFKAARSGPKPNQLGILTKLSAFTLALGVLVGCAEKKQEDTAMDECNPYAGFFKGGEHYIDADSVNEDGTINRRYMLKHSQKKLNACDPRLKTFRTNMREKGPAATVPQ